ncbi:MAG: hypothetical protein WD231_03625 [Candidatus Woykebacteria bacterium]
MIKKIFSKNLIILLAVFAIILYPLLTSNQAVFAAPETPQTPDLPSTATQNPGDQIIQNPNIEEPQPQTPEVSPEEAERQRQREERRAARRLAREQAALAAINSQPSQEPSVGSPNPAVTNIGTAENSGEEVSLETLSAANSDTGSDSENNANSNLENNLGTEINNDLNVDNGAYINVDSGHNGADKNTGDGEVVSGDADLMLTALNVGNNVGVGTQVFNIFDDQTGDVILDFDDVTPVSLGTLCSDSTSANQTTGSYSENDASTTCTSNNTILVDNNGNIVNDYYLSADTGHNSASKNTGDGSVTTGDANVVLNVINFFNNTFLGGAGELLLGIVNVFGNLSGDIVLNMPSSGDEFFVAGTDGNAANSTTGSYSDNNAGTNTTNNTNVSLTNSADILNNLMLFGDTGGNDASKNTGSGSVLTGGVNANLNVTNISNTNAVGDAGTLWLVLVNNLGEWTGQIWGFDSTGTASPFFTFSIGEDGSFNAGTGEDSTNNASTSTTNNTGIDVNNRANLTNNVYINANTGGNSASMNTGSGIIKSGDVNVAANIMNILNNNFVASRFVITIVNVFGSFFGDVFPGGEEQKADVEANEDTSVATGPGKTVVASNNNQGTGFGGSKSNISANNDNQGSALSTNILGPDESRVEGITKVIGKDSKNITDYWWIAIPLLLIAAGTAAAKRRQLWKAG